MNKFIKYCPNVWVAECEEEYKKGDLIFLETKYGKQVECEVYNFLDYSKNKKRVYSIVRTEEQSYAERKAEKYNNSALKNIAKSNEKWEQSQEGKDFLSLAEPIKIGHSSEKRQHSYDLTYAKKAVNELKKKVEIAMKLWGDIENE